MKIRHLALSVALICPLTIMAQAKPIKAFSAQYHLYSRDHEDIGTITRQLLYSKHDQFAFQSVSKINILWMKDQITLDIHGQYKQNQFHPKQLSMHEVAHQKQQQVELPKGSYDNASYLVQLQSDLAHHITPMKYSIYMGKDSYHYQFKQVGSEIIKTPMGKTNTVILQSQPIKGIITQFYFAPKYDYTLVKTEQFKNQHIVLSSVLKQFDFIKPTQHHA